MEGIGAAASIVAIVDLSAKVATLCVQYSKEVSGARSDIERLHTQVKHLETTLRSAHGLVEGDTNKMLSTSQEIASSFQNCFADLEKLEKKLNPNAAPNRMRRFGFRAIKWPFNSKEVDRLLDSLGRYERTIHFGLQIDQTNALDDIRTKVDQLQLTEDASISRKPHFMVPFTPNPDFIHRPEIETWMQDQYSQPDRRMALVGMGGVGKSQLAIRFAHRLHENEPGTSVFWVYSRDKATFEESFRAVADILALPRRHDKEVNVLALVRDWLQRDDTSPWLMIVDNADDVGLFFPGPARDDTLQDPLASYLPKSTKGKILVTSRSLDAAERLVDHSRATLQILAMGKEQALELLHRKLRDDADEAIAMDLVGALDCIPLAVTQAAAYINRRSPRVTPQSYLDQFRTSENRKDSLLRTDKGDLGRYEGASNSVVVTWQVTFEQIRRDQPRAANLLSLMSQFQAQNIPESMLHGYQDNYNAAIDKIHEGDSLDTGSQTDDESGREDFEDDMDILRGYCLVSPSTVGFCEMHSLVQFCTRLWISKFGDLERWRRLFMKLAADHFPSGEFETWADCQRLLPHVEPILGRQPRGDNAITSWAEVLTNVSHYMLRSGNSSRAGMLVKKAIHVRKGILGPDHPDTLESIATLASTYWDQGQWEKAEKLQVQVLETRKAKLGADHPRTLTSMGNLASMYRVQGQWEKAEKLQLQVLETQKAKLGADHPDTLTSIGSLALTYWKQGQLEAAEKLQVQVLEALKAKLGAGHPDTLTSIANLALTYWEQGQREEAEKLHLQVLETQKAKLGADHPDTLTSMANLASMYRVQGQWEKAEKLQVRVLETQKAKLGADHPNALITMGNLALTYYKQGQWEAAEKLQVQVLETLKAKLGADHPDTLTSIGSLALTYWKQGQLEEAEKLQVQVLETRKAKLGADHPSTLTSMGNLALMYRDQGQWEEAEKLQVRVLETRKAKLGASHPDTLVRMSNLALTYWEQGQWEEAEKLQVQVLKTLKAILGADHPDTLTSMANLALTWHDQGREKDALVLMQECVYLREKKLGHKHPHTQSSVETLESWKASRLGGRFP